jgi:hypothetical protein
MKKYNLSHILESPLFGNALRLLSHFDKDRVYKEFLLKEFIIQSLFQHLKKNNETL